MGDMGIVLSLLSSLSLSLPCVAPQEDPVAHVRALDSEDEAVRTAAIAALGKEGKKVAPLLFAEMCSPAASERRRTGAVEALGQMKKTGLALLEDEIVQRIHAGNVMCIMNVIGSVGATGSRAAWATPALVKVIERKPEGGFVEIYMMRRSSAIMALGRLGPASASVKTLLQKHLKEDNLEVRISSACAIWWTGGDPELVKPVLLEALKVTNDVTALEKAIFGLGEMGALAKDAVPALEALRESAPQQTQVVIKETLERIRGGRPPSCPRSP